MGRKDPWRQGRIFHIHQSSQNFGAWSCLCPSLSCGSIFHNCGPGPDPQRVEVLAKDSEAGALAFFPFPVPVLFRIREGVAVNCGFEDAFSYEFENHQAMLGHLSEGCGVVMIGAHTGSWQMGFPFADSYGAKVNVVMFDNEVEGVKKVLESQTRDSGIKVIPVAEGDISSIFAIRDALSRGEVVSFQGDRFMEGNRVLEAELLGHKAFFPAGPFIISSKLRVKVVFYFAMREKGRRYRFIFREATAGAGPQAVLNEYVAALDDVLSRYPQQWFNYYDFWNLG